MTIESVPKTNFRYDINALRAIAVLGVLFYHFKVPFLSGGFSGVDVFFVISGYLMTRIIVSAINKGNFSFRDYLAKRLKRIVPALLFLVFVLSLIGFFLYLPEDYKHNQKNAAASLLFLSNILYWRSSNYFDPSSDTNIFLHTWSLSVEWQFYLIYPFTLIILSKVFKRKVPYISFFIGATGLLLITSIVYTHFNSTASFYLLPTRAWEMLAGGIAFLAEGFIKGYKWRKTIALTGYLSILVCIVLLQTSMLWPSVYTILPVLATFLVIMANYSDFKIIKHESVQFIGKISYSLYLWHWPVYVIAQYFGVEVNPVSIAMFTIISFILAYFSYYYIESNRLDSSKLIVATMSVLFLCTAALSYYNTNTVLFEDKTLKIANYKADHHEEIMKRMSLGNCFMSTGQTGIKDFNKESCLNIDPNRRNILLIGDSHAAHLSVSLSEALEERNVNLLVAAASGGGPGGFPTIKASGANRFTEVMNYVYHDFIPQNGSRIDGVIISANWEKVIDSGISPNIVLKELNETIEFLNIYNIKTIILGQTERYTIPYPTILAKEVEYGIQLSAEYLDENASKIDTILSKEVNPYYVRLINTHTPPLSQDNVPYMYDENHFTKFGADMITQKILADPVAISFLNATLQNVAQTK